MRIFFALVGVDKLVENRCEDALVGCIVEFEATDEISAIFGADPLPHNPGEDRQNLRKKEKDLHLGEQMQLAQKFVGLLLKSAAKVQGLLATRVSFENYNYGTVVSDNHGDCQDLEEATQSLEYDLVENLAGEYIEGYSLGQKVREQNETGCQMERIHEIEELVILVQVLTASGVLSIALQAGLSLGQKLRKLLALDLGINEVESSKYAEMQA